MTSDLVPTLLDIFDTMIGHPATEEPSAVTASAASGSSAAASGSSAVQQRQFPVLKIVEPGDVINHNHISSELN